jgi:DNA primase
MSEQGLMSAEERRRLLEANAAAARFYRRELLRATNSWSVEDLHWWGAEKVLSTESTWNVGYAPSTWTSLVDHLRSQGFGFGTLVRAGLVTWTDGGDAVDRHPDQLATYRSSMSRLIASQAVDSDPPDLGPGM